MQHNRRHARLDLWCRGDRTRHRKYRRDQLPYVHKHQIFSVQPERFARGQLQIWLGFICAEPVGKTHRAPTGAAGSIPAKNVQTLKLNRRGGTVAASQTTRTAKFSTGSELSAARNIRLGARLDPDRSGTVEIAFGFAQEQLAGEYRDDRAC